MRRGHRGSLCPAAPTRVEAPGCALRVAEGRQLTELEQAWPLPWLLLMRLRSHRSVHTHLLEPKALGSVGPRCEGSVEAPGGAATGSRWSPVLSLCPRRGRSLCWDRLRLPAVLTSLPGVRGLGADRGGWRWRVTVPALSGAPARRVSRSHLSRSLSQCVARAR